MALWEPVLFASPAATPAYVAFVEGRARHRLHQLEHLALRQAEGRAAAVARDTTKTAEILGRGALLQQDISELTDFLDLHHKCIRHAKAGKFCCGDYHGSRDSYYCWFPAVRRRPDYISDGEDDRTPAGADREPPLPDHEDLVERTPVEQADGTFVETETPPETQTPPWVNANINTPPPIFKPPPREQYPQQGVHEVWVRQDGDHPAAWLCFQSTPFLDNTTATTYGDDGPRLYCLQNVSLSIAQDQLRMWIAAVRRLSSRSQHGGLANFPDELFRKVHAFLGPLGTALSNRDYLASVAVEKRRKDVEGLLDLVVAQNLDISPVPGYGRTVLSGGLFWSSEGVRSQLWQSRANSRLIAKLGDKTVKLEGISMWPSPREKAIARSSAWDKERLSDELAPRATKVRPGMSGATFGAVEIITQNYFEKKGFAFEFERLYGEGYEDEDSTSGLEFKAFF
ncbi:unnamed protein product [Amoebophrya sp. A120]|nr:unnamed protein product [Amoebophrya sp. A120]|eukprot:GSA120T00025040001.1